MGESPSHTKHGSSKNNPLEKTIKYINVSEAVREQEWNLRPTSKSLPTCTLCPMTSGLPEPGRVLPRSGPMWPQAWLHYCGIPSHCLWWIIIAPHVSVYSIDVFVREELHITFLRGLYLIPQLNDIIVDNINV